MDKIYSFDDKGIVEVQAPDGTKLTVAQSLELFRRQILKMNLMTENSAANLSLIYAAKHFATPQLRAHHFEAIATLLETSEDNEQMNDLKALVEVFLGREILRKESKPMVEEVVEEPEAVVESETEEPLVEEPAPESVVAEEPSVVEETPMTEEPAPELPTEEAQVVEQVETPSEEPVDSLTTEPSEEAVAEATSEPSAEVVSEAPSNEESQS